MNTCLSDSIVKKDAELDKCKEAIAFLERKVEEKNDELLRKEDACQVWKKEVEEAAVQGTMYI